MLISVPLLIQLLASKKKKAFQVFIISLFLTFFIVTLAAAAQLYPAYVTGKFHFTLVIINQRYQLSLLRAQDYFVIQYIYYSSVNYWGNFYELIKLSPFYFLILC